MKNWRKEIANLKKLVAEQAAIISALRSRIAQLEKTSRNSSKPPSSDIVKPQPDGKKSQRKIDAQAGHSQHLRPHFPAEQVNEVVEHELATCPDCGHSLQAADESPKFDDKSNSLRNHSSSPNIQRTPIGVSIVNANINPFFLPK